MRVLTLKPNHICQNPNCTKGTDGKPKHYYACDYCNWSQNWRSIYCCIECRDEARQTAGKKPVRTDISQIEVDELMNRPLEEVLEKTMADLADYKEEIDQVGIGATIDLINEEIDAQEAK